MCTFTVVLETCEPFGPEVQVVREGAEDAEEAALRVLHHWHNGMEFNPNNTIKELEDGTVRVLTVLEGHSEKALHRNPSGKLV